MSSPKRLDLQGIRAFAIIVVLGFHFYPQYMPNGYLGVDQFFVLSGFLMCMLLKRAEKQTPCSLVSLFYSKRFKRILPLYLLLILLSMIALYSFFPDTAIETNKESATHALLFLSNRPKTVQEDYFAMLSIAIDIFTHTWSLSVEIQFYFLVPIIFIFARKLSPKYQYLYYGFIGIISAIFFISLPPSEAFNSVFARMWQFLIGMIVYLLTTSSSESEYKLLSTEDEKYNLLLDDVNLGKKCADPTLTERVSNYSECSKNILLFSLISVISCPITLPPSILRPLVTIFTGLLMLISQGNKILSNRFLTYIGDVSYSLYLIHWPIYAYWKLTAERDQLGLIVALLASVVLAIITFETYEKWYLTLSSTNIGILVVMLYFMSAVLINKDEISGSLYEVQKNFSRLDGLNENMSIDDAAKFNYEWNVNDYENLYTNTCIYETTKPRTPLGWCNHTNLTGRYRIATIGNSWSANHAKLFYQECGHKAKSILQGSAYGCEPLYPSVNAVECKIQFDDFAKRIENEKPDYAFIISRFITIGDKIPDNVTVKDFDHDPIYQVMKNQTLNFLSNIKYKLYILDAVPCPNITYIKEIVPMLKKNTDPAVIDNFLVNKKSYEKARERHAQLVIDTKGRVELIDYLPTFFNKTTQTYRYFDEQGFSYFTTPAHLSPHGLEYVRHVWRDFCKLL
uniref:HTH_Tnp_Tc3_2 domain-containing protein n=1 Tax=Caenorhabditis japonica TaxID=281687 RepID=A0A8R1HKQ9_CAEJA